MIIRDYTEFLKEIKRLQQDNYNLLEDNLKLQVEYHKLKESIEASGGSNPNTTHTDFLRILDCRE